MNVIEFYSGTQELAKTFRSRGHEVITLDIDPKTKPDMCVDILKLNAKEFRGWADVTWFSPDCRCFSIASCYRHWKLKNGIYTPQDQGTIQSMKCVAKNLQIIATIEPKLWFIENPRGMMNKMFPMEALSWCRKDLTQCQYGRREMKPTHIWTNSKTFEGKSCKNGAPCHIGAPRGSQTGTQGLGGGGCRAGRERLAPGLCKYIVDVCEQELT